MAAIIDWHSKKILSWKLSNTMDMTLVTTVLKEALALYPTPEIFNTDQGSQYTAKAHVNILKKHNIKISMDGVGRATDNICIERYMIKYNSRRLHSTIDYKTPNEVYYEYINNLNFQGGKLLQSVS